MADQKGWATPTEADSYFDDERHITTLWDALADDDDAKNKVLNMAYNRIYYNSNFSVPAAGNETDSQLIILIKVQSEMAYYLLMHQEDEDRRKGLQAQSVKQAGTVKETYNKDMLNEIPIPPIVVGMLEDFKTKVSMVMIELGRDENEDIDEDVVR